MVVKYEGGVVEVISGEVMVWVMGGVFMWGMVMGRLCG